MNTVLSRTIHRPGAGTLPLPFQGEMMKDYAPLSTGFAALHPWLCACAPSERNGHAFTHGFRCASPVAMRLRSFGA
ncbi:MAG: hypothetical protein ACE5EC_02810, partial [Phycisphaerae bacterium]